MGSSVAYVSCEDFSARGNVTFSLSHLVCQWPYLVQYVSKQFIWDANDLSTHPHLRMEQAHPSPLCTPGNSPVFEHNITRIYFSCYFSSYSAQQKKTNVLLLPGTFNLTVHLLPNCVYEIYFPCVLSPFQVLHEVTKTYVYSAATLNWMPAFWVSKLSYRLQQKRRVKQRLLLLSWRKFRSTRA